MVGARIATGDAMNAESRTGIKAHVRGIFKDVRNTLEAAADLAGFDVGTDPYQIVAYRGYGTARRVLVHGRVLECENVSASSPTDSLRTNLINTLKRIESDPVAAATVRVSVGTSSHVLKCDAEGFFREWVDLETPLTPTEPWQEISFELLSPLREGHGAVTTTGLIQQPTGSPTFGIISDLDDTVIQSRITSFLQAVRTVMLGNARTRLPFPGVAAFYQALEKGGDGTRNNPIFYVSSSPWNIYDIISDFMDIQRIPSGPILLRDWDIDVSALSSRRLKTHKEPLIREILDLYPELKFILIGDNSQRDPEIYRAILDAYPGRILAIYIRNVKQNPERTAALHALSAEVLAAGSAFVLADDTYAAAKHAAEQGWITAQSLPAIKEEKKADEGTTGTKADAPGTTDDAQAPTVVVE
jgi:phosphatidate phosphatase APP1